MLEPQGMNPFLVFCDSNLEEDKEVGGNNIVGDGSQFTYDQNGCLISCLPDNFRPNLEMLEQQRVDTIRTYIKLLGQVRSKLASGIYTLDNWRRILKIMNKG